MGCACVASKNKTNVKNGRSVNLTREMSLGTKTILKELNGIPNQYSFKKVLGHGAYGRVLLWESPLTNHQFAVKAITKGDFPFSRMVEEVNILSKVDHPNIVKYIKSFQSKKYLYVIMEYCSGGSLFHKIMELGKFGESTAMQIMQEIMRAINHCHHLGIIHRDLKPENVMYSDDGILKIIDFGLSMKENTFSLERLAGTKYYIAPEVISAGKYTKACDVWSLGVIMHILLSGYVPIAGKKIDAIFDNIVAYKGPTFSAEVWKSVSTQAKDLIIRMLDTNYETRISVSDALEHPWFKMKKEELAPEIPDILESLREYSQYSKLKRRILNLLFKGVNDIDLLGFKKAFVNLDRENTGMITCKDLESYLKSVGYEATANELENFTRKVNKDGNAYINYSEFISAAIATKQFLTDEKLEYLFKVFDVKNNGEINQELLSDNRAFNKKFTPVNPSGTQVDENDDKTVGLTFDKFKCILLN